MIAAMSSRELFAQRDYMRLWWARLAGVAASQMMLVAIGWQMYDLTGSAWDLGLVGLLQFLPALALVLVAGHVVDRHHRARIVAACVGVQGLVALALAAAPFDGLSQRTLLLALSVALGAVRAFQMPAQQALVPLLVPPGLLPRAMAFSSAGLQGAIIAGPALGGLLYVAGPGVVYGSCALLFVVATALCLRIRHANPPPGEPVSLDTLLAGRALRAAEQGRAGRHLARPVRGAAGRRRGAVADVCQGHPARRARGAWACCAARRRWAPWPCRSCSRAGRSRATPAPSCSAPSPCSAWQRWSSGCPPPSPCRWPRCSSPARPTWSAWSCARP